MSESLETYLGALGSATVVAQSDPLFVLQSGVLKKATVSQVLGQTIDPTPISNDTNTIDLTGRATNYVQVDDTDDIDTIVINEGDTADIKFNNTGGKIIYGGSLAVPGKADYAWQADDVVTVHGLAGGAVEILNIARVSGKAVKPSIPLVRTATATNITISTALNNGDTLNGLTLATGDVILVAAQSAAAENGIYVVGVSPARHENFSTYDSHVGLLVFVENTNYTRLYFCTAQAGGTLGSTAINFASIVSAAGTTEVPAVIDFGDGGLNIWDSLQANRLGIKVYGSSLSGADRLVQIDPVGSNRIIHLGGSPTFGTSGCFVPPSAADSGMPNNSIYYSTDSSKLVYKDSGGSVHDLY